MSARQVPVLYLDIDGTVREGRDDALGRFVNTAADVRVFPAATALMSAWRATGGRIAGVTNQGGVALGITNMDDVGAALIETDAQTGHLFDHIEVCIHHPDADTPKKSQCWCRKPSPGLVIGAAVEMSHRFPGEEYPPHLALMVGDRDEDRWCAQAANIHFEWASDWRARAGVAL